MADRNELIRQLISGEIPVVSDTDKLLTGFESHEGKRWELRNLGRASTTVRGYPYLHEDGVTIHPVDYMILLLMPVGTSYTDTDGDRWMRTA